MRRQPWCRFVDEARRAAWKAAIAKQRGGEDVPPEDHYALLRSGMFAGEATPDILEEAALFLRYWIGSPDIETLPWFGKIIADHWFQQRDWDRKWARNRTDALLQEYIAADDLDHWTALNNIAAMLHRARDPFPHTLADWAADVHDGKLDPPRKERSHKGDPPYAQQERNAVFAAANDWLKHFGMERAGDRIGVIAEYTGHGESVVSKGLTRHRTDGWRRAPWS